MIPSNIQELFNQKDTIEAEITEQEKILTRNRIGLSEPLVDREGFPRADIDVASVRGARTKIIRLQNDLKEVMKKVELALHEFHASKK